MFNEYHKASRELEEILDGLTDELTTDDIMYILMNHMRRENIPKIEAAGFFPEGNLMFKLNAEITKDPNGGEHV